MGLFSKKPKVDMDQKFKDTYKDINKIVGNANAELDFEIKVSLLKLASEKYQDLFVMIDQGANFEKEHFESLKKSLDDQIEKLQGL